MSFIWVTQLMTQRLHFAMAKATFLLSQCGHKLFSENIFYLGIAR
jgi:hypothetical protein